MHLILKFLTLLLAVLAFSGPSSAAPTLVVDTNGILTGARDVLVDGVLYDVDFRDGSCIALFSGCDSVSDFVFQTQASARLASQALLASVLVDGAAGNFDTAVQLTNGCTSQFGCQVWTPYALVSGAAPSALAGNAPNESGDAVFLAAILVSNDTTTSGVQTFALWSRAVPEPSTIACLGLGGLALFVAGRRRNRKSQP